MSTDLERLLAAAADDSDQPLHTDVGDILVRARRSVRKSRIAAASTAIVTTAAILGGIAAWSATRSESAGPAGTPKNQTITIDAKTGRIVDNETGKTVVPAPPVSPLSDAEVLRRCKAYDPAYLHRAQMHQTMDKAGPVDARWKIVVKSGDRSVLNALFLSPDKSVVFICTMSGPQKPRSLQRTMTTEISFRSRIQQKQTVEQGLQISAPGVTRALVDITGESSPREALVGTDGFLTLGNPGKNDKLITVDRIRGYDAGGTKVYDQVTKPYSPPSQATVDPTVTVKTADPITPQVVLTKDPQTGKALAPAPPVSPLTDEQVTTRCRAVDDIYFKDLENGGAATAANAVIKAAGPVTSSWKVALKTGTGDKLTAVLISPDKRVFAWCHMLTPTAKGAYDYTRGAVQANGKFADNFDFEMVPDGVAQIIVDLPKQGPTRALISNGFYTWGLTGGNAGIQKVRVRGFDAQGKKVYDKQQQLDVDFD
ncbi:hypothetical protein [Kribbella sp. NBC_00359]|uniref:hypothetical protein n=1 Tax=Kribbella sp. NBC_00359 TaxID=2975966 RepID=UPI002E1BC532